MTGERQTQIDFLERTCSFHHILLLRCRVEAANRDLGQMSKGRDGLKVEL
jgi:hypothetical protein